MHQTMVATTCTETRDRVMNSWEWGEIREGLGQETVSNINIYVQGQSDEQLGVGRDQGRPGTGNSVKYKYRDSEMNSWEWGEIRDGLGQETLSSPRLIFERLFY